MECPPCTPACPPWPLDPTCLPPGWDPGNLTPEQCTCLEIASGILKAATGYVYGPCLVTVRPCMPQWHDICPDICGCEPVCKVMLPYPVTCVVGIRENGVNLPKSAWRVEGWQWVVRQDGTCFPRCQRLDRAEGEAGTWSITYWRGYPIPAGGRRAVTALAGRICIDCQQDGCWLDPRITRLDRNGVTYEFEDEDDRLKTWLRLPVISTWLASVNPNGLQAPMVWWTPEMGQVFTTTHPGEGMEMNLVPADWALVGEEVTLTVGGESGTAVVDFDEDGSCVREAPQ